MKLVSAAIERWQEIQLCLDAPGQKSPGVAARQGAAAGEDSDTLMDMMLRRDLIHSYRKEVAAPLGEILSSQEMPDRAGRGRRPGIAPMITALLLPGTLMPPGRLYSPRRDLIGPEAFQLGQSDQIEALSRAGVPVPHGRLRTPRCLFSQLPGKLAIRSWFVTAGLALAFVLIVQQLRVIDGSVSDDRADHHRTRDPAADPARERNAEHRAGTVRFRSRCGWRVPADRRDGPAPQRHRSHRRDHHRVGRDGNRGVHGAAVLMRARRRGVAIRLSLQEHATGQITLRWTVILLVFLLMLAEDFGLDIVLGGFWPAWCCGGGRPATPTVSSAVGGRQLGSVHPHLFHQLGMTLDIASILVAPGEPVNLRGAHAGHPRPAGAVHVPGRAHHQPALADGLPTRQRPLPLLVALSQVGQRRAS